MSHPASASAVNLADALSPQCLEELQKNESVLVELSRFELFAMLSSVTRLAEIDTMPEKVFQDALDFVKILLKRVLDQAPGCRRELNSMVDRAMIVRRGLGNMAAAADRAWIETYLGVHFHPLKPQVDKIHIEDIAHSLSNLCRFGGHSGWFYSVAQHSVLVSQVVPPSLALEGLLHDATEAYLLDLPLPIKSLSFMRDYLAAERQLADAIGQRFGLTSVYNPEIVRADTILLKTEFRDVMSRNYDPNGDKSTDNTPTLPQKIVPLDAIDAEQLFLDTFDQLTDSREADLARKRKE